VPFGEFGDGGGVFDSMDAATAWPASAGLSWAAALTLAPEGLDDGVEDGTAEHV
jgi:hypothetical protein